MVRGAPATDHGEGLSDPLLGDIQVLDADGRITRDLKCLGCGYNLRTLRQDGRCPECGQAVAEAVRLIFDSPRRWLGQMADGAAWLATGLGIFALILALMVLLSFLDRLIAFSWLFWLGLLGVLVAIVGAYGLTARHPERRPDDKDPATRKLARICTTLAITSVFFIPAGLVTLFALPMVLCGHIAVVMRRINRPDLARFARLVLFVSAALEALIAVDVTSLVGTFPGPLSGPRLPEFGGLAAFFALLLTLIILFARTARALRSRIAELCAPGDDATIAPGPIVDTGRDDPPTPNGV